VLLENVQKLTYNKKQLKISICGPGTKSRLYRLFTERGSTWLCWRGGECVCIFPNFSFVNLNLTN